MFDKFPIVAVETSDKVTLHGLLLEPEKKNEIIYLHTHGTSGSFYGSKFLKELSEEIIGLGIPFLSVNNRGHDFYTIEKGYPSTGASVEIFEDCVKDLDAWIKYALDEGYKKIIISGHSFGTEKVVYYMNKGKYADRIISVILMGFSDNVGTMKKYLKKIDKNYRDEALHLVKEGKGEYLLSDLYGLAGELPISAQTYLNFTEEGNENSKALPLRNGKSLDNFRNIKVPILGVISDNEEGEYTIIPIKDAMKLLERENSLCETKQIKNTNHLFNGKERELAKIVGEFLERRIL